MNKGVMLFFVLFVFLIATFIVIFPHVTHSVLSNLDPIAISLRDHLKAKIKDKLVILGVTAPLTYSKN